MKNVRKFKTADANEKGTDARKDSEDVLLVRRMKWSILRDSALAIVRARSRTISRQPTSVPDWSPLQESHRLKNSALLSRHSLKFPNERTMKA